MMHRIYRLFEESGTVDPLSPRKRLDCRRLNLRSELHAVGVILHAEPINVPRGVVFGGYMQGCLVQRFLQVLYAGH